MSKSIFSTSNKWAEYERRKRELPPMSAKAERKKTRGKRED